MTISEALKQDLAKVYGAPVGTIDVDGEALPLFRPLNWHKDEPIDEPIDETEEVKPGPDPEG